jgi:hypothetical protein
VQPQALYGKCILRPGFPTNWDSASLKTPYIEYRFAREAGRDVYYITQNFAQPLQIVLRQNLGGGRYRDIQGTNEHYQVISVETVIPSEPNYTYTPARQPTTSELGLDEPNRRRRFQPQDISSFWNANVDDIFKNRYTSPRPAVTTLQLPVQGVGEWCHPQYTPSISDSVFRTLIKGERFTVAGVPFNTPAHGHNIVYTSLFDNYPDSIVIPITGTASSAYLLLAGSTNHMQCHIDNAIVVATYADGSSDTLRLRNPENWCPIEQDYYADQQAFRLPQQRPYRICLGNGTVSRNLGADLNIQGVYGREIPGGAAQMLRMHLRNKPLNSITLRTLSNDVVVGLMAITLQK